MSSLAALIVSLEMNAAKFVTGTNAAIAASDAMSKGIDKAANIAKSALGGIAAGLTIGAFAHAIKEAIDFADSLNDMSQKTGVAVETLGGLGYAGKTAGVDLETIGKASNKLAKELSEAAAGGKEASGLLKALGVDARDSSGGVQKLDEALFQMADKFEGMEDGAAKAALASQAFGDKLGANMIPLLNMGSQKLREMVEDWKKYGGVTAETAARADEFNDTMEKVHLMSGAFTRQLAAALLPVLQAIANIMVEAKEKSGGFGTAIEGIVATLKVAVTAGLGAIETFRTLGQGIGAIAAAVVAAMSGNWKQIPEIFRALGEDTKTNWTRTVDQIQTIWNAGADGMAAAAEGKGKAVGAAFNKGAAKEAEKLAQQIAAATANFAGMAQVSADEMEAAFAGVDLTPIEKAFDKFKETDLWAKMTAGEKAVVQGMIQIGAETTNTTKQLADFKKLSNQLDADSGDFAADYAANLSTLNKELESGRIKLDRWYDLNLKLNAEQPYAKREAEEWKKMVDEVKKADDALVDLANHANKQLDSYIAQNNQLEREAQLTGLTAEARARAVIAMDAQVLRSQLLLTNNEAGVRLLDAQVARQQDLVGGAIRLAEETAKWSEVFQEATGGVKNVLLDIFDDWHSAGKKLWDNFKKWALDSLAQIAAKQLVVSIVGALGLGGSAGALAAGNIAGQGNSLSTLLGSGGGSLMDVLSGASSLSNMGGMLGTAGSVFTAGMSAFSTSMSAGAMGAVAAGLEGTGIAAATLGAAGTAGLGSAMVSGMTAALASNPVGWAALAAMVIYSIASGMKDVPAERSASFGSNVPLNPDFAGSSAFGTLGIVQDSDKWFSIADQGKEIQAFISGLVGIDNAIATIVGKDMTGKITAALTAQQTAFEAGIEHQPTSFGEVAAARYRTVLTAIDERLGAVFDQFSGSGQEMSAFIVGLAQFDQIILKLTPDLQDKLIGALDGTAESLSRVTTLALALAHMQDLMNADPMADAMMLLSNANVTAFDSFMRSADALRTQIDANDDSTAGIQALTSATDAYYVSGVKLLMQIQQIGASMETMFGDTRRNFFLDTLDNNAKKNWYQDDANVAYGLLSTASDPDVIKALGERINADYQAAWGLMTPEQKAGNLQSYDTALQGANTYVQQRLTEIGDTVATSIGDTMGEVSTKFGAIADKMMTAADGQVGAAGQQQAAANTQMAAANTPVAVNVTVRQQTSSEVG